MDDHEMIDMHQNRYKYFRWTPRTAKITFAYVVVVPTALVVLAYGTNVRPFLLVSFVEVRKQWKETTYNIKEKLEPKNWLEYIDC